MMPKTQIMKTNTQVKKCQLLCGCVYLGISQPQTGHATSAVRLGVDGAEFLFDRAEISHESVKIHVLPLIQRLCRQTNKRERFKNVKQID